MPKTEREFHPFLKNQITDFDNQALLSPYSKLIVGTSPIYALTSSTPIQEHGVYKKNNWQLDAFIQYFYGSKGSHFWTLFASSFDEKIPTSREEAINLLNKYGFLISDVFQSVSRNNYSPLDSDLINQINNNDLRHLVYNSSNLKVIYFTSKIAKKKFAEIMGIPFINAIESIETIFNRQYKMIVLISPAGNGRTVRHFFNTFPLSNKESELKNNRNSFALIYRQRYYQHFLRLGIF